MKILFLSVLAATAISSLNFSKGNIDNVFTKNNEQNLYLKNETRNAFIDKTSISPKKASIYSYYETDEPNNSIDKATTIEHKNFYAKGTLSYSSDEDWFIFSIEETIKYTMTLTAPSFHRFYICEYARDPQVVYSSYSGNNTVELKPGTYYLKFYVGDQNSFEANKDYSLKMYGNDPTYHDQNFQLTNANMRKYKMAIWENDVFPKNFRRWNGREVNTLASTRIKESWDGLLFGGWNKRTLSDTGYVDPIFTKNEIKKVNKTNGNDILYETFLDSVIYVWDKDTLNILKTALNTLITQTRQEFKDKKIAEIKSEVKRGHVDGGIDIALEVGGTIGGPYVKIACEVVSKIKGMYTAIKSFFDIFNLSTYIENVGTPEFDISGMLHRMYEATIAAYNNSNIILRIPRYTYVVRERRENWNGIFERISDIDYKFYSSCTLYTLETNQYQIQKPNWLNTTQSDPLATSVGKGRLTPIIDGDFAEDFLSNGQFTIPYGGQVPTLQSITLSGNYQTNFIIGECFTSYGLKVTANYTCGVSAYATDFTVTEPDMNTLGQKTVTVSLTEGDLTKTATYSINVNECRYGKVEFTFDHDYYYEFSGHGQNWYIMNEQVTIPNLPTDARGTVSITSIEGLEEEECGYYFWNVSANCWDDNDWIEIHLETADYNAHGTIIVNYSYQSNEPIPEPDPVLESITLSGMKTLFLIGEDFTSEGLVVTAHYDNGEEKTVTDYDVDYSQYDKTEGNDCYEIVVSYEENETTVSESYSVAVRCPSVTSITLSGNYRTEFETGDTFTTEGLIVTAHYDYKEDQDVTSLVQIVPVDLDMNVENTYRIYINYIENKVPVYTMYTIHVTYVAPVLQSISLSGDFETEFNQGDDFNCDGLVVTANYDKDRSQIIENYTVSEPDMNIPGYQTITVTYAEGTGEKTADYTIHIAPAPIEAVLESITLSGDYQTTFAPFEEFNYDGLIVTAHYDGKEEQQVTDFTVTPPRLDRFTGKYIVKVSYTENGVTVNAFYEITRRKFEPIHLGDDLESITLSGNYQTSFRIGATFNYDGLIVTAHYSGNVPDQEVKNFTVLSNANMNKVGIYEVVVSYTEGRVTKTATYTITVGLKGSFDFEPEPKFPIGKGDF